MYLIVLTVICDYGCNQHKCVPTMYQAINLNQIRKQIEREACEMTQKWLKNCFDDSNPFVSCKRASVSSLGQSMHSNILSHLLPLFLQGHSSETSTGIKT